MQVLGHPLTWPTTCFIDGGCGAAVFAHTNGSGDFVLLDELGSPWPVHQCYLDLFCPPDERGQKPASEVYTNRELALQATRENQAYKDAARRASEDHRRTPPRNIRRVEPETCGAPPFFVVGYIQSIVEGRAQKLNKGTGALAEQAIKKALGRSLSQITIVDGDYRSYTTFVDLQATVLSKGATVKATIRRLWVLGLNDVFVCDLLDVFPIWPR